jgi:signal peptidase II
VIWVVVIAAAIAAADQSTKWLVLRFVGDGESRAVINGFFNLVQWRNTGAAWGIFQDYNTVLAIVSVLTILVLYLFRHSFQLHHKSSRLALGLIAGGIVGNFVDRVRFGYVVDFLDFFIGRYHWPAFNLADSAICVGVALYVIFSWSNEPRVQPKPAAQA